jgi:hypothetical protein
MPLDHYSVTVPASKFKQTVSFLTTSLAHLGFKELYRPTPTVAGMGEEKPYFWVDARADIDAAEEEVLLKVLKTTHIAFAAESMSAVIKAIGCD